MSVVGLDRELTDGVVAIRPPSSHHSEVLIEGRDAEFYRFMGEGSADPNPTAVVLDSHRRLVGWIDYDTDRSWLADGEVNIGYNIFSNHRGHGFARRSLELLISFLGEQSGFTTATLLIDPGNAPSIAVAERSSFHQFGDVDGQLFFKRPI